MTLKASQFNIRGCRQRRYLRITVSRSIDAESVALHDVGALFQSAIIDGHRIPQVLRTRGYY